jgi:hypothetical protein
LSLYGGSNTEGNSEEGVLKAENCSDGAIINALDNYANFRENYITTDAEFIVSPPETLRRGTFSKIDSLYDIMMAHTKHNSRGLQAYDEQLEKTQTENVAN